VNNFVVAVAAFDVTTNRRMAVTWAVVTPLASTVIAAADALVDTMTETNVA
jgi:hypothetical protein